MNMIWITGANEIKWMRWVWRNGGMKFVAREHEENPEKTYPGSVSSTTKPTWRDRDANSWPRRWEACATELQSDMKWKMWSIFPRFFLHLTFFEIAVCHYQLVADTGQKWWSHFNESMWIARMPVYQAWRTITGTNEMNEMMWKNGGMKIITRENGRNPEINLPALRFVYHKTHVEWLRRYPNVGRRES